MIRDSMVFYRSFAAGIEELPETDQLQAFWNIVRYGLDGIEPKEKGAANAVFKMARPQIDINNTRYANGTKGGRRKTNCKPNTNQSIMETAPGKNQNVSLEEARISQDKTKEQPKDNQDRTKVKPNDNVNENDIRKENPPKGGKRKENRKKVCTACFV